VHVPAVPAAGQEVTGDEPVERDPGRALGEPELAEQPHQPPGPHGAVPWALVRAEQRQHQILRGRLEAHGS
jgi:hypothetical protein